MTDLREDTYFIGRTDELYKTVKNLQSGIHTLLTGDKGIGKSRLMIEAMNVLNGTVRYVDFSQASDVRLRHRQSVQITPDAYRLIYIKYSSPLSSAMKQTTEALFNVRLLADVKEELYDEPWEEVQRQILKPHAGSLGMQNFIFRSVKSCPNRMIIIFDNLDRITPAHQAFLEMMLGVSTVCAATIILRDDIHLKKVWSSFDKLEIKPLSETTSEHLVEYLFQKYPIKVIDRELFKKQVLKASSGNPFHIKNYLWQATCRKYIKDEDTRAIQEVDANKFLNLGPVYVFVMISFTIIKIFSTGISARESYIYFTGVGFIAMVIFRVFRGFFIFKPQKQTSYYRS